MKIILMICKYTNFHTHFSKIDYLVPTCIHLNNWGLICVNCVACMLYPIWGWIVQICWKWVTMIWGWENVIFTSCNWLQIFKHEYSASCANLVVEFHPAPDIVSSSCSHLKWRNYIDLTLLQIILCLKGNAAFF